jgi:hypothetical protein
MAKSGASQQAIDAVKPLAIKQTVNQMDPQRPQSKSWFQRNIYDKAKAASRWTFAGLQLLPDLAQNVGAEIFSPNDSEGFDGIFKSTQLGTLMANSDEAGDGFFLGGEAAKLQAERARDYRGVIEVEKAGKKNYQAWTVGRGAARLAFTPGSRAYNVMSGFVDAAVSIGSDPTGFGSTKLRNIAAVDELLPGALATAAGRARRAAIPGITDEAALAGARAFARGEAGLDAAESIAFRQSAFGKFVTQDKRAVRLTERLAAIGADTRATPEMKTLRILTEFGDSIDPTTARRFAEADTVQKVQGLLGEASSRLAQNPDDILLPRDIRDIRLANRFGPAIDDAVSERIPLYRSMRNSKWWQNVPKGSVVVNGTGRDKTQAIRTYSNYLKGIGIDEASKTYTNTMSQVVRAYSLEDPGAARAQIQNVYDTVLSVAIEKASGNSQLGQRLAELSVSVGQGGDSKLAERLSEFANIVKETGGNSQVASRLSKFAASAEASGNTELAKTLSGFAASVQKSGGNREMAQRLSEEARKYLADARAFNVDEIGWADDGGFMQMLRQYIPQGVLDQFPPDAWDRLVLQGPGALIELAEEVQVLPDFRQMRTLASNPFVRKALLNKEGDQRGALVWAEFIQNEIWKPAALATGGYVMRNMMDAQVRIAMGGLKGFFNHPIDYIQWALRKKGFEDILSGKFDDEIGKLAKNWGGEQDEFYEALTFNTYKNLEDTSVAKERMMRNGNFSLISRGVDRDAHTTGYVDNLAQLFGDEINQQVARIKLAEGINEQTTLKRVRDWLFSDEGAKSREKLREYFKIGIRYVDPETGKTGYIKFGDEVSDEVLVQWVNKLSSFKVNTVVKDNKELRIVAAYNKVPLTETINGKTRVVGETRMFADDIMPNDIMSGDGGIGSVIDMGDGQEGLIIARRTIKEGEPDFFTGVPTEGTRTQYIVQPVHKGDALQGDLGSAALRGLIDTLGDEGRLATVVKRAERGLPKDPVLAQKALKAKDRAVDFFFNNLYGRATQKLEKSPVFRQYYYNEVLASADLLAPEQARTLLDNIVRNAKETGVSPAKYVGNKKILNKLREISNSKIYPRKRVLIHGSPSENLREISPMVGARGNKPVVWMYAADTDEVDILAKEALKHSRKTGITGSVYVVLEDESKLRWVTANGDVQPIKNRKQAFASLEPTKVFKEIKTAGKSETEILNEIKNAISTVPKQSQNATGTIEQLDQYAKAVALRQTKELLYNATERSNIEDIMRIMVPFGSAWKEVLGTYASAIIEDPTRIRRAQLIFDAARKFDPDGDGEGFFYRDPTTGEYSFNFPASGWVSKLLTGQEAPLQAPVKRLSIGLGVVPSVGPVAQLAASQFLPDTPNTDFIASILIPYGRKEGLGLTPRWATRLKEVVEANTTNLQTVYGNTYTETVRALTTSGEYNLSIPEEKERLYADARGKARILAGMRVLGQFFGPTSPSAEFKIDTAAGDMYASELVKEFQKLQTENYDTAVSEFLRIYGNDAMLYLSNKSESLMGGLEATEEFADWERTNSNLFNKYPDVAGFMAPGGDDFSFEAWSRQLRTGKRRRLTDREIVAAAQYKIANDQYRALREKLPTRPSDEQRAWLRQWRVQLNKQYPGFPVVAEFNPGEFPGRIEQMKLMVKDPALQDNDAAQALAQYLDARDKAVEQYVQSGGAAGGFASALAAAPLRDWLANIGLALKEDTPEFARIYDRILSNEVEE